MSVLDKLVVEEIVLEEGPGRTWVKRFVEGPNAGTRFVARFELLGERVTRVTMDAYVGANGFALGLGKLSPLGLEKAMARVMGEYKKALQGYEPGRARGRVLDALAVAQRGSLAMRALDETKRKALTAVLLESAWAIACVDEGPDEAERDAMRAIVNGIWHATLSPEMEDRMVEAAVKAIEKDGANARCVALGARLKALGFGGLGLSLAVLVAEVSHGLDPAELDALRRLASAAGLDDRDLEDIVRDIDGALGGGETSSRVSRFV
jgi:tellurite resistance protein